jgi:hypothetical protein
MTRAALILILSLLLPALAIAQPGRPVEPTKPLALVYPGSTSGFQWRVSTNDPPRNVIYLYNGGELIGSYDFDYDAFRWLKWANWQPPITPAPAWIKAALPPRESMAAALKRDGPTPSIYDWRREFAGGGPASEPSPKPDDDLRRAVEELRRIVDELGHRQDPGPYRLDRPPGAPDVLNFGLSGTPSPAERITNGGTDGVEGSGVPDQSKSYRLSVVCDDPGRRQVMVSECERAKAEAGTPNVLVAGYERSHFALAPQGFKVDGECAVYLQQPSGGVLARADEWPGRESVAATLQALRPRSAGDAEPDFAALLRRNPHYDPARDPAFGRRHPVQDLTSVLVICTVALLAGGAGLAVIVSRRRGAVP